MTFMLRVIKLLVRNQSVCRWILPFVLWPITKKSHTFKCSSPLLFPPVRRLCWTISRRNHPFCVAEDEFCSGEHVDKLRSLRTLLSLSFKTCIQVENWFKIVSIFWCLIDPMLCTENKWNQSEWITQLCWNEFLYCLHFSGILECGNFLFRSRNFPRLLWVTRSSFAMFHSSVSKSKII